MDAQHGGESARDRAARARAKAERLERYAELWDKGADGEAATADALAELGDAWVVRHDLRWPGRRLANIDHIAIGPGGVFVIDSKNWSGSLTVRDGVLRQNGFSREEAVAACAESAIAVGDLANAYLDRVWPVLCFRREEPITGWARDVILCSTGNIREMLSTREVTMTPEDIAYVARALDTAMVSMQERPRGEYRPTAEHRPRTQRRPTAEHRPPTEHPGRREVVESRLRTPRNSGSARRDRSRRRQPKVPLWMRLTEASFSLVVFVMAVHLVPRILVGIAAAGGTAH